MSSTRRPTMRDVAQAADVSLKTVSRVVNGEQHVAPATLKRVAGAIDELGYQVDDRARRLRRRETTSATIGFVLVDVANEFFSSILAGLEEVARSRDYLVLAGSTDGDPQREDALIRAFTGRRVDGLVVVTSRVTDGPLRAEIERGTPVVILDLEPDELLVDVVRSDHRLGGRLATAHLLEHGHRDIAFIGDVAGVSSADERFLGYQEALHEAGVAVARQRVVRETAGPERWAEIAEPLLVDPPSAVFAAQNSVTLGVVRALHRHGLQEQVALVGHDDIPFASVVSPGITVVPQRPRELGRLAAERLFDRVAGDEEPARRRLLASELIVRGSGELPPAR